MNTSPPIGDIVHQYDGWIRRLIFAIDDIAARASAELEISNARLAGDVGWLMRRCQCFLQDARNKIRNGEAFDLRAHRDELLRFFGAPGDWGYEHQIGIALQGLYAVPILPGGMAVVHPKVRQL